MSFNHFKIHRQAHTLSRNTTNEAWNPFRHVEWGRPSRANTWDVTEEANASQTPRNDSIPGTPRYGDEVRPSVSLPARLRLEKAASAPVDPLTAASTADKSSIAPEHDEEPQPEFRKARKKGKFFKRVEPKTPFTVGNQIGRTFLAAWINTLLVCVPVGFVLRYTIGPSIATFVINLAAAVPLLFLGDDALHEMSLRLGDVIGGLIYIFTSNLVQLISCILLLVQGQGAIVQFTLVGGILANLLLVLGSSLFFGGLRRTCQYFNRDSAHVSSNLLSLASTSLLIPTASRLLLEATPDNLAKQSRGAAFILILVYVLFLLFQLVTHKEVFLEEVQKVPVKPFRRGIRPSDVRQGLARPAIFATGYSGGPDDISTIHNAVMAPLPDNYDEEEPEPELHFGVAVASFVLSTVLLGFVIDFVVGSIDALTTHTAISPTFVGLILLPLPNCDFSAITSAVEDKMELTMNCTVGKCLQTALFVTPLVVLLAWPLNVEEVSLVFNGFEIVSLFVAVLLLNFLMIEGKVTWIQGVLLLADWVLIAIAAFYATRIDVNGTVPAQAGTNETCLEPSFS